MADFKNNKEGKIDELKGNISKQKGALQKHAVIVKTEHKELQTATLELGMLVWMSHWYLISDVYYPRTNPIRYRIIQSQP